MLNYLHLKDELGKKVGDLRSHAASITAERSRLNDVLRNIQGTSADKIAERLAGIDDPGAVPSAEIERSGSFFLDFNETWTNHEEARQWAASVLERRTTFAADGSQIYVEQETSLPVGAIQVGWFENAHDPKAAFIKDVKFRLFSPTDLLTGQEEPLRPETRLGEERFLAEAACVEDFLRRHSGWQQRNERMPLAFFDGTFLVSIAMPKTSLQRTFVQAMVKLVRLSEETRVPLVGYIDRSFSRDLVTMLTNCSEQAAPDDLFDAALLYRQMKWGSRTAFCFARRLGMDAFVDEKTKRPLVGFVYLQTSGDSLPARLDVPSWMLAEELIDEAADVVRAECIVGLGYPYPLEAADQMAVIHHRDREVFLRALQEVSMSEDLGFSFTRKQASKQRRR